MSKSVEYDVIVIGGGAAGFFFAVNYKALHPSARLVILEKSNKVLSKVKVSGGGRCNVTHACFEPKELVKNYPRGAKELLGPFHKFQPGDTIGWFAERGVELKIEEDGRMFPTTDDSQTIIDCFLNYAKELNVSVELRTPVEGIRPKDGHWEVQCGDRTLKSGAIFMATGGTTSAWKWLADVGHRIVDPVPSLFTFNIKDVRIKGLPGVSVPHGAVRIPDLKLETFGPLLVTHWGLSGPGILRLSSVAARELADQQYRFEIKISWTTDYTRAEMLEHLKDLRSQLSKQEPQTYVWEGIPKRLSHRLLSASHIEKGTNWADLRNDQLEALSIELTEGIYQVTGKSTFKDEFVTAGGVDLREIDFRTMESKVSSGLYFGGEVLDIDALTGGFNFQAAWTTAWLAAQHCAGPSR